MKTLKYLVIVLSISAGTQLLTACTGYVVASGPPLPPDEIIVAARHQAMCEFRLLYVRGWFLP